MLIKLPQFKSQDHHADQPVVLVVEDEAAQREGLSYNLEAEGFRVARAENGEEALMMVDEEAPDIIVLDWMTVGYRSPLLEYLLWKDDRGLDRRFQTERQLASCLAKRLD